MRCSAKFRQLERERGFTLVEILAVLAIVAILAGLAIPAARLFERAAALDTNAKRVEQTLRLAQSQTLASLDLSQYGVMFDTGEDPHRLILFQGEDYASSATSSEETIRLSDTVELFDIALAGGGNEVVFDRLSGTTPHAGSVSIRFRDDPTSTTTIYIAGSGRIGREEMMFPSDDDRIADSRHVHFQYTRTIATSTDSIVLRFFDNGSVEEEEEIAFADSMTDGQLYWEGEVEVDGEPQRLVIRTHAFNDITDFTIFSIHRDLRYNTKRLQVDITDDPAASPQLIEYDASGDTTQGNSSHVSAPEWQ